MSPTPLLVKGGGARSPSCGKMSRARSSHSRMGMLRPNTSRFVERQPSRPHTSLGFATSADQLPCVGFDVRDYFRKHGSGAGLTVGVNGRPSSDAALQNYVQDCRTDALLCELVCDGGEMFAEETSWREDGLKPRRTSGLRRLVPANRARAPLCWDAVVQEAPAKSTSHELVTSPLHVSVDLSQKREPVTALSGQKRAHTVLQTLQTSRHMISYGKDCVKDWGSTVHLDIHVPNTDECISSQQSELRKVQREPIPCVLQPVSELLSALLSSKAGADLNSSDSEGLLCIWFQIECLKRVRGFNYTNLVCFITLLTDRICTRNVSNSVSIHTKGQQHSQTCRYIRRM